MCTGFAKNCIEKFGYFFKVCIEFIFMKKRKYTRDFLLSKNICNIHQYVFRLKRELIIQRFPLLRIFDRYVQLILQQFNFSEKKSISDKTTIRYLYSLFFFKHQSFDYLIYPRWFSILTNNCAILKIFSKHLQASATNLYQ